MAELFGLIDGWNMGETIMSVMEIMAQVAAGKLSPTDAMALMPKGGASKTTTMTIEKFKDTEVAKFTGNFPPFSMGRGKLRAVLELSDQVKAFCGTV